MKKTLGFIVRIVITVGVLYLLFQKVDIANVWATVSNLNIPIFIASFLLYCGILFLAFIRWRMILVALDLRVRNRRIILAILGGLFFNLFLPSTVGGDLIKGFDLFGHTRQASRVAASVIIDRLSGFAGLAVLSFLGFILGFKYLDRAIILLIFGLFSMIGTIFFFILHRDMTNKIFDYLQSLTKLNFLRRIRNLYDQLSFFADRKDVLIKSIAVSTCGHLVLALIFYMIVVAMGIETKLLYFVILIPIISAISTMPISIGGLGVRDVTSVYLLSKVGIAQDVAVATSLLTFFFMVATGTIGGIIYVFAFRYRRIQSHQTHLHSRESKSDQGLS